jgi:GNAT superfamily N-acetyltransferase
MVLPMPSNHIHIRQGTSRNLAAVMEIWYANETMDDPNPAPCPPILPEYPHLLETGKLWIAEQGGLPIGFSGVVVRGQTAFLTDLFVHPQHHAAGIGTRLLAQALDEYAHLTRFTVSSSELPALALYIRYGMQPLWPHLLLQARNPRTERLACDGLRVEQADPSDPQLIVWDADISGRERSQDHAAWVAREGGVPIWIMRQTSRVGYAYVRQSGAVLGLSERRVGPIGARTPADAAAVLATAIHWAASQTQIVRVNLLGPHPGLAALLNVGFRISYVETLMLAGPQPPFDPRCYCGSGGALF